MLQKLRSFRQAETPPPEPRPLQALDTLTHKKGAVHYEAESRPKKPNHLVIVVHGIGSQQWTAKGKNNEQIEGSFIRDNLTKMRTNRDVLLKSHFPERLHGVDVAFETVEWHSRLHDLHGVDKIMQEITLPFAQRFRMFLNDTFLDVLYYMSPTYEQVIISEVTALLNGTYRDFMGRHPDFDGPVSVFGHSLGSVISYDILRHQPGYGHVPDGAAEAEPEPLAAGGRPLRYPRLDFRVSNLFCAGSPLAVFLTLRGAPRGRSMLLRGCPIYNIFHPHDPVAYRLEPLLASSGEALVQGAGAGPGAVEAPCVLPHWRTGGLRSHYRRPPPPPPRPRPDPPPPRPAPARPGRGASGARPAPARGPVPVPALVAAPPPGPGRRWAARGGVSGLGERGGAGVGVRGGEHRGQRGLAQQGPAAAPAHAGGRERRHAADAGHGRGGSPRPDPEASAYLQESDEEEEGWEEAAGAGAPGGPPSRGPASPAWPTARGAGAPPRPGPARGLLGSEAWTESEEEGAERGGPSTGAGVEPLRGMALRPSPPPHQGTPRPRGGGGGGGAAGGAGGGERGLGLERDPEEVLRGGLRFDFMLQERAHESLSEYLGVLPAHFVYWKSRDTMLFLLKVLLRQTSDGRPLQEMHSSGQPRPPGGVGGEEPEAPGGARSPSGSADGADALGPQRSRAAGAGPAPQADASSAPRPTR
eukprot:tig00001086_g6854.t1